VIESRYLISIGGSATSTNLHLSEQQIISCVNAANGYGSAVRVVSIVKKSPVKKNRA
jgi:hypothetical protein